MRCAPQFDGVVSFNISGTGQAPERVFSDLLESRASQFADEQNDVVKSNAKMFKRNWMACFSPRVATKKSPACNFTNDDVKSYLSQFFCGEAAWGNELPRRQAKKLKDATKPGNIDECKQRLMERRRESALKAVKAEPAKLAALHKEVKDKDESTTSAFFGSRMQQAEDKLNMLLELAPEKNEDAPVFARPYKLRSEKESDAINELQKAVQASQDGESL